MPRLLRFHMHDHALVYVNADQITLVSTNLRTKLTEITLLHPDLVVAVKESLEHVIDTIQEGRL
jgi:hypothetical protein